jgi:CO/xanthine dehydrogenase Mo-binding subunit
VCHRRRCCTNTPPATAFGLKCVVGREEVAVAAAALRLRRPVSWIEDRQENLTASFHGHEQRYRVKAAFSQDGAILGLDAEIDCDTGAYSAFPFTCAVEPLMASTELPGVYKVPAYRARGRAIATNKVPSAPYRGVSRPQIVLVMERLMEKAAEALGLDSLEVRRRNLINSDEFPYTGVNGITYDEGSYRESLDLAEKQVAERNWPAERDRLREQGLWAGIGYSCFSERTAFGTPAMSQRASATCSPGPTCRTTATSRLGTDLILDTGDYPALLSAAVREADRLGYRSACTSTKTRKRGFGLAMFVEKSGLGPQETADVTVSKTGAVHVASGGTSLGQGIETVLAQIAADALGVDPGVVRVAAGDTVAQPFGAGSWASRSTAVGGSAVHQAATAVRERALQLAARILEVAESDLDLADGSVTIRGDPAAKLTLAAIALAAEPGRRHLRPGEPAGLTARRRFEVARMTYPYGAHAVLVEGDTGTGRVRVLRYLVAYEVGRAINPMLVEGQLRGGVAQGIGGALFEEFTYDEDGQPQAITFIEYRMPTAAEIPPVDVLLFQDAPSPGNPLGVMGAGEGGVSAAGGAVANALRDALGLAGGVGQLPLTPREGRS